MIENPNTLVSENKKDEHQVGIYCVCCTLRDNIRVLIPHVSVFTETTSIKGRRQEAAEAEVSLTRNKYHGH